jgi:hypothetical protein
VVIATQCTATF